MNASEWTAKMRYLLSLHESQISLITPLPKENTMENNAVTSDLAASLAQASDTAKVTFTQPTDTSEVKDFSEFARAEEEVEEPTIPVTSIKGRTASLLTAAAGAMSASAAGVAMWDTFTKLGFGGDMKVVKSKNWGGVLSPERKAAIVEHNARISENAFNQARRDRKQQKAQAKQILGCKPVKSQKKQMRKARTLAAISNQGSQFGAGVSVVAEQLIDAVDINHHLTDASEYDKPQAIVLKPYQAKVVNSDEEVIQNTHFGNLPYQGVLTIDQETGERKFDIVPKPDSTAGESQFIQTELVDTRTNIGDVVTALDVVDVAPASEKVLLVNDESVSIRAQVADVDVERSYPSYKPEESTPAATPELGPNGEGDGFTSDIDD